MKDFKNSRIKQLGGRRRQWHLLQGISLTQKAERKQIVFPLNGPKALRTTEFNPHSHFLLSLGIMFERGKKKDSNWSMCTTDLQNVPGELGCLKKASGELRGCRTGLALATGSWPTTPLPLLKEGHGVSALNPVRNNKSCSFGGKKRIYLQTASETEHLLVNTTLNSTF